MTFRPMLAYNGELPDFRELRYPVYCTPKIDGIRALKLDGKLVSRTLKAIPNDYIRTLLESSPIPDGFDGELVCPGGYSRTESAIMSRGGLPPFCFRVFDWYQPSARYKPYFERVHELRQWFQLHPCDFADFVMYDDVHNEEDLLAYEAACLDEGYEGVIIRAPDGPYKKGRSTLREGYMLKLKRFKDSEAVILDFIELSRNNNEQQLNELGYAERSSAKAGQHAGGTLGALVVRDPETDCEFRIGSGFTQGFRDRIWQQRHALYGKKVKYKYQPYGKLNAPRHPIFLGFRDEIDL